jgi:hypothetical protein
MKRQIRGAAFAAAPFLIGSAAHAQDDYTAPRNAAVDATGARAVEVEAAAGILRVEGKPGLRQVQVTGTARSSSQQFLSQIKLIAERRGDVVFIKADIPDRDWGSGWRDDHWAGLDLVIQVPQGINAEVSDGSGDAKIFNVGSLEASDGSGGIHARDVKGSVVVESDGSGSIEVQQVGRDFRVESKGSGSIDYSAVSGAVNIPERHRERARRDIER